MKPTPLRTVLLSLLLLCASTGLAWLWLDLDGHIKNSRWHKPAPLPAVVPAMAILEPAGIGYDEATLSLIIEKPLFALDRKVPPPPAPPPPPPPPPPPDALKDAHLFGLIAGEQGFVIVRAEGKVRNVKLNDTIGDWTLKNIQERTAQFERNNEQRVLTLEYAKLGVPVNVAAPLPTDPTQANGAPSAGTNTDIDERRKRREAMRARQSQ